MSSFTDNVHIAPLPKENLWVTTKAFTYYIWHEWSDEFVTVPEAFIFDGTTVPKRAWRFIQKVEPRTLSASALHDWLYTEGRQFSKWKTEGIFIEALVVSGCPEWKAWIMRCGVTLFWWWYWYKVWNKILDFFDMQWKTQ